MHQLDKHDLDAIQAEAREDWEFNHHGLEYPFTDEIGSTEGIPDDEVVFEIDLNRRLSVWA